MATVALIVAAGRGERLASGNPPTPKALVMLAGRPMLEWSVDALTGVEEIGQVVVALPPAVTAPPGTVGVLGGAERSHSVRAALRAADPDADVVLVHDAARPLVTREIVRDCLAELLATDCDAAIAATPVADTIKESAERTVVRTLDRSRLWAVQTPQVFRRDALERALGQPDDVLAAATDDASLIEAAGGTVRLVPAPRENLKVTTPEDLRLAELLLLSRIGRSAQVTGDGVGEQ